MPFYSPRAAGAPILINDNTGGYMVMIAGQPVTALAGTLSIECAIGRRSTANFTAYNPNTTTHFQQYQQVQIYDASSYMVFSGYITNPQEKKPGFRSSLITQIQCVDQHFLADKRIIAATYLNQTPAQIVQDIVTTILASEGVTVGQIYDPFPQLFVDTTTLTNTTTIVTQSSAAIPSAVFAYCTVAEALDALTQASSSSGVPYYWQIDQLKRLYFVPYTQITGPAIDGTRIEQKLYPPQVTRANATYRNTQYIIGGTAQTITQIETRMGDGNTQSFTMGYELSSTPIITVNGITQTVGLKGTTGFQWYWNQGENTLTQDSSQTKLATADTLTVTYIGQYPTVVSSGNPAQVTYESSLDGSSGIIEEVEEDATITSLAGGYQEAGNLLTRYGQGGTQLQFSTMQSGYVQGQYCPVSLAMFGLSTGMLLESVTIDDRDSVNLWYTVNAVSGPYDQTWVDFLGSLIGTGQPMANLNVGVSQSLALLAPFTATLTPTATYSATVFACPIVNTSTLCGTGTIVC